MAIDYEAELAVDNEQIEQISKLVVQYVSLSKIVDDAEEKLKEHKKQLRKCVESDLPQAMGNMESFTLKTGESVSIKETLYASIPKKNKDKAARWLEANDLGSLVKEDVTVGFQKGEQDLVTDLVIMLKDEGYDYSVDESINTASVKSAIKELLADGKEVPMDLFGAYFRTVAVIK